jgi:hypothetical protein
MPIDELMMNYLCERHPRRLMHSDVNYIECNTCMF